ncbi:MAG TPA: SapC family protein [Xanthobacteraceae bacterium]|jgi:hypothetical protein|nr:SapC family protein [Xanthobacteraceae bacterium]
MTVIPLSRETHGKKHLKPVTSFEFARNMAVVRILAGEAAQVALNFPIVFINENNTIAPFALLGLGKEENLFVSDQGQWLASYVPALLRRYPFFMGKASESDNLALLIEDTFLSDNEGELLFGPDEGEPKGPVARAIQLLTEIAGQDTRTAALTKVFVDNGLIEPFPLQVTRGATSPVNLTGINVINETKLNSLSDDKFLELRRSGALGLAYTHLLSMGQIARLRMLIANRLNKAGAKVN